MAASQPPLRLPRLPPRVRIRLRVAGHHHLLGTETYPVQVAGISVTPHSSSPPRLQTPVPHRVRQMAQSTRSHPPNPSSQLGVIHPRPSPPSMMAPPSTPTIKPGRSQELAQFLPLPKTTTPWATSHLTSTPRQVSHSVAARCRTTTHLRHLHLRGWHHLHLILRSILRSKGSPRHPYRLLSKPLCLTFRGAALAPVSPRRSSCRCPTNVHRPLSPQPNSYRLSLRTLRSPLLRLHLVRIP